MFVSFQDVLAIYLLLTFNLTIMKKLTLLIAYLAIFAVILTSCSKEDNGANLKPKSATLSFGAILNDLMDNREASKQAASEIPECSDDVPTYVSVVLSRNGADVVGSDNDPFEIRLVDGQIFTEEVTELQLDPDTYSLEHFAVYNEDDEVIWIAPRAGSDLGGLINNPLPLSIDLQAGVKKYVEVSVLCFDYRQVNEYGYLFFELVPTEAVEFCFFANYCPPNSGDRHHAANYSVSIWRGTTASGAPLYTSVENTTGQYENGDYYAEPLCFALPSNDDMDEEYLYYEVTLLDWTGNYGTVAPNTIKSGTLSMNDIINNFDGPNNVEYEHLRFGCGDDGGIPVDTDNDGIPDSEDDCPTVPGQDTNNGCPEDPGCVYDEVCIIEDGEHYLCRNFTTLGLNNETGNLNFDYFDAGSGHVPQGGIMLMEVGYSQALTWYAYTFDENGFLNVTIESGAFSTYVQRYVIEVRPLDPETGEMSETCREIVCNYDYSYLNWDVFSTIDRNTSFFIRIEAVSCPEP